MDIESNDDIIRELVKKRGSVKGKFTLFAKYLHTLDDLQLTEALKYELEERFQKVKLLFDQFTEIQDELDLVVSENQLEKELQEREAFQDQYYSIVANVDVFLKFLAIKQRGVKVALAVSNYPLFLCQPLMVRMTNGLSSVIRICLLYTIATI